MVKDLNKLAREIFDTNQYMTIASSNKQGEPWASAVVYAFDKNSNLYFLSLPSSKHSQNIKGNKNVVVTIFDSHQLWGQGVGLQVEGWGSEVNISESAEALKIYFDRNFPYGNSGNYKEEFTSEGSDYKFYKITPKKIWMNDPNNEIDRRVEVHP